MSESQNNLQGSPGGARRAGGRPTSYRVEFSERARELRRQGATDKDLATVFGVSESTLNKWKIDHPEFSESLRGAATSEASVDVAPAQDAVWQSGSTPADVPQATYYAQLLAVRRRVTREGRFVQVAIAITHGPCAGAVVVDSLPDSLSFGSRLVRLTGALGGQGCAIDGCVGAKCRIRVSHAMIGDGARLVIAQADAI